MLSVRRATKKPQIVAVELMISIHALREEGDEILLGLLFEVEPFLSTPSARRATTGHDRCQQEQQISIHALREEGDAALVTFWLFSMAFLSTPSARRATRCCRWCCGSPGYFYPRPPRGGRHEPVGFIDPDNKISIHALREEGDRKRLCLVLILLDFYPRPPRGGRPMYFETIRNYRYFYPRPPRGGRPEQRLSRSVFSRKFLSTPSARRATVALRAEHLGLLISIHALREEGDPTCGNGYRGESHFYPRPPRGGRRHLGFYENFTQVFLSTPSARRATRPGSCLRCPG